MTAPLSRFSATPAEVDAYLRTILAEDTYLRYQQTIGSRATWEAARDLRMDATQIQLSNPAGADLVRADADRIDPMKRSNGGPYPSALVNLGGVR